MQVALLSYTPSTEHAIAVAAHVSSSITRAIDLLSKLTPRQVHSLIVQLNWAGHLSPFEHASFNFAINGIFRVTSHQLVRHRVATYTQRTQRHVSLKKLDYVISSTISCHP